MLKEKIGQMLIMGFRGADLSSIEPIRRAISERELGGVILFANNVVDAKQLSALTHQLQQDASTAKSLPLFMAMDYEGGTVERLNKQAGFPETYSAEELGAMDDAEIAKHARQMAMTLKSVGINLNFAPVVDVNVNPENPIIGKRKRSFSKEAKRVATCASMFARAHIDLGVRCALKHFPGHGSSLTDSHLGFVDITNTWQPIELDPYRDLLSIYGDRIMVMIAHVVHSGFDEYAYPASLSQQIVQGVLREQLHFNGVVVSDDMQMKAIVDHYGMDDALRLAINAGVDMLIFGNQLGSDIFSAADIVKRIENMVLRGEIAESRILQSYERVKAMRAHL